MSNSSSGPPGCQVVSRTVEPLLIIVLILTAVHILVTIYVLEVHSAAISDLRTTSATILTRLEYLTPAVGVAPPPPVVRRSPSRSLPDPARQ